ncbi:MAG TPA: alanine--glyoxylate aminotransferase family protein [Candidatus Dormibacteraeota bacterium]|nr:alanine--glyoxylate aminotransferase family protein [Candidatus Dormibacteraeota bacterium]
MEHGASDPLLMIPGPTPVADAVLRALAEPVRSHTSEENAASLALAQEALRACFGAADADVFVFGGSGTLAMEAAIANHARAGDRVVVASHGFFGARFEEICVTHGMAVTRVEAPWGRRLGAEDVARACADGPAPALVALTHVDTSTGVLADAAALAAAARDAGAMVVMDGVCATGGIEEAIDAWGVDVALTGAQKALGVPPGLAILATSARARERRQALGPAPLYYADLSRWESTMRQGTRYFSTHATSLIRALEAGLEIVMAEGLAARFERHRRLAARVREGFAALGFTPLTEPDALAPTLSVLAPPPGVDEAAFRDAMLEQGVLVAGCIGELAGRGIRVAHMGNVGDAEVDLTLRVAAASL